MNTPPLSRFLPLLVLPLCLSSCDDPDLRGPTAPPHMGKQGQNAKIFNRIDTNKDGILSPEEREEAQKKRAQVQAKGPTAAPHELRPFVLKKFDLDGDGVLSEEERAAARKSMREKAGAPKAIRH